MDENPVAAWQVHCDGVQAVLDAAGGSSMLATLAGSRARICSEVPCIRRVT